jgi:hypothetical protein
MEVKLHATKEIQERALQNDGLAAYGLSELITDTDPASVIEGYRNERDLVSQSYSD